MQQPPDCGERYGHKVSAMSCESDAPQKNLAFLNFVNYPALNLCD